MGVHTHRMPFDPPTFTRLLPTGCSLGQRLEYHASLSSTMTAARELVGSEGGASLHGAVVLADEQTAGLGRRGRSWDAEACCSLLFSLVWAPAAAGPPAFPELVRLNLAAPLAVAGACSLVGVSSGLVKWPNDVWAGVPPKKLSGVLLDYDGREAAVLGVGVNVLQDMSLHPAATSVATLLAAQTPSPPGREAEPGWAGALEPSSPLAPPPASLRERLLASFCGELERLMRMETAQVVAEHRRRDLLRGQTVRVHHRTREEHDPRDYDAVAGPGSARTPVFFWTLFFFYQVAAGIGEDGALRVRRVGEPAGREVALAAEEVSISPLGPAS